jgi:lipoprotein-releasing system permease protein
MPLLASLGVVLCVAMVLIVWSVMGGFLRTLVATGRTMTGDVVITWPNIGFAHYDDLIRRLEADPAIEAAAPLIETYGMITTPNDRTELVAVRGVDGPSFARVTQYEDTLWWRNVPNPTPKQLEALDPRTTDQVRAETWDTLYQNGLNLTRELRPGEAPRAAMVPGIESTGLNRRRDGIYVPRVVARRLPDGTVEEVDTFLPIRGSLMLTVLPFDSSGGVTQAVSERFPVANEFMSGVYEIDNRTVLVRLDALQRMLRMNPAEREVEGPAAIATPNPDGTESFAPALRTEIDPARVTHVLVRGKGDLSTLGAAEPLRVRCEAIYEAFHAQHQGSVPHPFDITIMTWEDLNRTMIMAVRKETALVLFIFGIICLVAVFLVVAIFWAMVSERTKDIGVLRAVGASRAGVAWLWIRYGLAIGLTGSVLGVLVAYTIVWNINPIHEWLGRQLGLIIWDPQIYYFNTIPNQVEPDKAAIVFAFGVLSCGVGAVVPALRAALFDPVKALRFE